MAGPKRPQDRVLLKDAAASFAQQLPSLLGPTAKPLGTRTAAAWQRGASPTRPSRRTEGRRLLARATDVARHVTTTVKESFGVDPDKYLDHGSVVIAAITSCTNTSNPSVMMAAGILAKKAVEKGLTVPPWVKTSLAPGSRVVTDYYGNPACCRTSKSCASTSWATGAPPASATPARCPPTFQKVIAEHGLVAVSCSAAIATSKAASMSMCAPIT